MNKKILFACCGVTPYSKVVYRFQDDESCEEYNYSFFKIARYLGIEDLYLLLTPEARNKHKGQIDKDAKALGLKEPHIIDIDTPKNEEEIWKQFDRIVKCFEEYTEQIEVSIDITLSFRHISLLLFTSMFYLESCNKASLNGLYYAAKEAQKDGIVPIFNIGRFANILRGSFAIKQFEKTGHISGIKDFINDIQKDLTSKNVTIICKNSSEYSKTEFYELKGEFEELQSMILNGLPFESGLIANNLLKRLKEFEPSDIEVIRNLLQRLCEKLEPIELKDSNSQIVNDKDVNKSNDLLENKSNIQLNNDELKRQLNFIEWHYNIGNIALSWVLLREWIVSRTILANCNDLNDWKMFRGIRKEIEYKLNCFGRNITQFEFDKENNCYRLLEKWYHNSYIRNQYAHAGHLNDPVYPKKGKEKVYELLMFCKENLENNSKWILPEKEKLNTGELVLATPMGASIGLLFSAVSTIKPDRVIVLTSEKFKEKAKEACEKACFINISKLHIVIIEDAFCGFNEANRIVKEMCSFCSDAKEIKLNLTGGTTAMQWAMQTLYENVKDKYSVNRIAFVDRRPSVEQQSNPYIIGELLNVDELIKK